MSAVKVTCPHPAYCKAGWHVAGTRAARDCVRIGNARRPSAAVPLPALAHPGTGEGTVALRARAAMTSEAPDPGVHRHRTEVKAALEQFLADDAAAQGWSPASRTAHPVVGHRTEGVFFGMVSSAAVFLVRRWDAKRTWRATYDSAGGLRQVEHLKDNVLHRSDGPALMPEKGCPSFYWEGVRLEPLGSTSRSANTIAARRFEEMTQEEGLAAETAVSWLRVECLVTAETARAVRDAGADFELTLEGARAGVSDVEALTQVARGELPVSWALAGA